MSYQVLARKWRPRFFREMVGQEHVLQALINALDHNRLHHAYLFTGTRGVGKTTIARILAKCLNCESGVSSEPCGQCSSCTEINRGSFVDLIEVDAASRTKVEDTRELLDNVQYAPTKGRYKVYLIDEVHMLSTHSFNALLKTLEEPPEHVKFLLATTDPQKLPATILSRCLQFHLKNMLPERIVGHLSNVLKQEIVEFEEPALWALARSADGSMRDALSLTDQAIAFGSGKVLESQVREMLGSIDQQTVYLLVEALVAHDPVKLLDVIAHFSEQAPDYAAVLDELLLLLHRMTIAQVVPDAIDNSLGDQQRVIELAQRVTAEELQLFYQMGLMAKKDFALAPDHRSGLEMAVLRMLVFRPEGVIEPPSKAMDVAVDAKALNATLLEAAEQEKKSDPSVAVNVTDQAQAESVADNVAQDVVEPSLTVSLAKQSLSDRSMPTSKIAATESALAEMGKAEVESSALSVGEIAVAEQAVSLVESIISPVESVNEDIAEALVPVEECAEPVTTPTQMNEKSAVPKADFAELQSNEQWLTLFNGFPFNGLLRSVAAESVLLKRDHHRLLLRLDLEKAQLYNERHAQQIADVLSQHFSTSVEVEIGLLQPGEQITLKTPATYLQELRQAAHDDALSELQADAGLRHIVQAYAGEIIVSSVVARNDE